MKVIFAVIFLLGCLLLSGCGDVNFAPGDAYMVKNQRIEQRT